MVVAEELHLRRAAERANVAHTSRNRHCPIRFDLYGDFKVTIDGVNMSRAVGRHQLAYAYEVDDYLRLFSGHTQARQRARG